MGKSLICTRDFSAHYDGEVCAFHAGKTLIDEEHDIVREFPEFFEPDADAARCSAIREHARKPGAQEAGAVFHITREPTNNDPRDKARSEALRAIERHGKVLEPQAGDTTRPSQATGVVSEPVAWDGLVEPVPA